MLASPRLVRLALLQLQYCKRKTFTTALLVILVYSLGVWVPLLSVSTKTVVFFHRHDDNHDYATTATATTTNKKHTFTVQSPPQSSPFAYAFVIGGCNPGNNGKAYLGFLYNVLIATRLLQSAGSTADVVLYIQMSALSNNKNDNNNNNNNVVLPEQDVVERMGIRFVYLDTPRTADEESFYEIVLQKFRVLQLTEYQRVLLLDADVLPFGNLDYFFELSSSGEWMENLVVATEHEPANGGFFLLTPHVGDWDAMQEIIRQREIKAADTFLSLMLSSKNKSDANNNNNNTLLFDQVQGWGHEIVPPDYWETKRKMGTKWNFNFAYSDQGLLYHWVKYVKKNVSIRIHGRIQHWTTTRNGTLVWSHTTRTSPRWARPIVTDRYSCMKWGCDWAHFTSNGKPWLKGPPDVVLQNPQHKATNPMELWFTTLQELNDEYKLGIDFENWSIGKRPTLGSWAGHGQVRAKVQRTIMKNLTGGA